MLISDWSADVCSSDLPEPGPYLLVDDLNIVFIVLNTFVGFTTSVFSASYIAHEIETGRLTPTYLRFYHAMYQALMFAMNLAPVANNIGLMWEIGRASCRERVCQYVHVTVVAVQLKTQ